MLASIRRPYLDIDSRRPPYPRQGSHLLDFSDSEGWADIRYLTNEERDQLDMHARVILSRCSDRVKDLELLEKRTSPFPLYYDCCSRTCNPVSAVLQNEQS